MPIYSKYTGVGGSGGGGGIQSINGDTTAAQLIVGGTGISVATAAGTTTVTNTAPMAATGNLTEATSSVLTISGGTGAVIGTGTTIQVLQSSSIQSGYLSSTDWSTFNGKQNALTFGNLTETGSSVLTITGGTGAVIGSGTTIQMSQAGAGTSGYLSSTDWNTFNNKQPAGSYITALTGEVTATGPGSATATIANQSGNVDKVLATNGTAVTWQYAGIGSGFASGNVILGRGKPTSLTGASNLILSPGAGDALSSGTKNILAGEYAGGNISSGQQNCVLGYGAGYSSGFAYLTTGNFNVLLGSSASTAATGTNDCVSIGYSAVAALNGVSIGSAAGRYNTGSSNVAIGYGALKGVSGTSTGDLNVCAGYNAGTAVVDGFANTLIGYTAGNTITGGVGNTLIGYNCQAASATTNNAFVLGSNATAGAASIAMGSSVTGGPSCVTIGQSSTSSGSTGSIVLGHSSSAVNTSNVFSVGSTVHNILTTYLGLGAEQILAAGDFKAIKLMTARAASGGGLTNLDASAGTLNLAGAQGSGTGIGGDVLISTAPAGSSGNTLNAHVERFRVTHDGLTKFNSGYGSVATVYGVRAWVKFNASTGTPTINASGNVTSITDNNIGNFTINFTNAMPDANYAVAGACGSFNGVNGIRVVTANTGSLDIYTVYADETVSGLYDFTYNSVTVVR
jgi:hypothetical protein